MRFKVEDKKDGYAIKHDITRITQEEGWISLYEVKKLLPTVMVENDHDKTVGWTDNIRLMNRVRVRQTKTGWFIYLPEFDYDEEEINNDSEIDIWFQQYIEKLQQTENLYKMLVELVREQKKPIECRVISKPKKNAVKEEFGYFHGFYQSSVPKSDGTVITQALGIVQMLDGTVRQVKPDHIIFGGAE